MVLGDYHYAALTQDGHLFTWGQYSKGALGLGDPSKIPRGQPGGFAPENPNPLPFPVRRFGGRWTSSPPPVDVPSEVFFDHEDGKRDKFVFAVSACGWHTVALVIDIDYTKEKESEILVHKDVDTSSVSADGRAWNEANNPSQPHPLPGPALRGPFLDPVDEVMGSMRRHREPGTSVVPPIRLRHARIGFAGRGRGRGFPLAGETELPQVQGSGNSQEAASGGREVEGGTGGHEGTFRGRTLAGGFRGLPPGRGRSQQRGEE